jgi:hypothetical protein
MERACSFATARQALASQIPLTRNEIADLFATLITQPVTGLSPAPLVRLAGEPGTVSLRECM